jgi:hypothetical protein
MAYGEIKVDTVTFTDGGIDKSVSISGLVQNPTFSGNITVTGTISGNTVQGQTVSGVTVTGTTANFVSGVFTTQISGATITGNVGSFTTITGGTVTLTSGVFASGTAAAPSVSIGTTDNGLYSPGADQVAVATNGTGRLFVDASGNVGVGTSSVNALLEVNNSTAGGEVQRIEGNYDGSGSVTLTNWRRAGGSVAAALKYNDDSSPLCMSIGTTTSHEFRIRTADTDAITIDASQRVGIGTSAPAERLTVNGAVAVTGGITGHGANRTTLSQEGLGGAFWQSYGADTSTPGVFQLRQASSDFSVNRVPLFIDSSGRLGIGTSTPGANLEVFGDTADVVLTSVTNNNATGANKSLNCGVGGATAFSVPPWPNSGFIDSATTNGLALGSSSSTGSVRLYTGTSREERLRITSAGLVGIGTSSPGSFNSFANNLVVGTGTGANGITIYAGNTSTSTLNFADGTSGNDLYPGYIIYNHADDSLSFVVNYAGSGSARMFISSAGNVGIGTTSPLTKLEVRSGVITAGSVDAPNGAEILRGYYGSNGALVVIGSEYSSGGTVIGYAVKPSTTASDAFLSSASGALKRGAYTIAGDIHKWYIGGSQTVAENSSVTMSEAMRIDSSGRLLVGTSTARSSGGHTGSFQLEGTTFATATAAITANSSDGNGAYLNFGKARGGSIGSTTIVQSGDVLGQIQFNGSDGTSLQNAALITAFVDGTPGANDMPGRLVFSTTADGASSPTERMRIDSSGRVGIGTTSPLAKLAVEYSVAGVGSEGVRLSDTTNSTVSLFGTTETSYSYAGVTGHNTIFYGARDIAICADNANNGQIKFATGGSEAFRVDSSRRLLVGTATQQGDHYLQVQGSATASSYPGSIFLRRGLANASIGDGNQLGVIDFGNQDGGKGVTISAEGDAAWGTNDYPGRLVFSTTADGASSPTERMRISNNGTVLISCTSFPSATVKGVGWANNSGVGYYYSSAVSITGSSEHAQFVNPNGVVGTITTSGSATAYNTSSDYRLKENVTPVSDGITRLQKLKPSRFNFIADPGHTVDGFIAHEAQAVVPEAITGEKDAVDDEGKPVYQGIDQSKLVPLLTAALQEAVAKIEALEARLTAAGL